MMKNNNSYKLPLALVFSLFFLWAISSNLLSIMIRQPIKTCELSIFETSFTETFFPATMLKEYWAYLMHVNEQMYHLAYVVPMVCFMFCVYYG